MPEFERTPDGISRRTVAQAAAWSIPLLAVAVAAPLAAASTALTLKVEAFCPELPFSSGGFHLTALNGDIPAGAILLLTAPGYDVSGLDTLPGFANGGTTAGVRTYALGATLSQNSTIDFNLHSGLPVRVDTPTVFTLTVQSAAFGAGSAQLTLQAVLGDPPAFSLC